MSLAVRFVEAFLLWLHRCIANPPHRPQADRMNRRPLRSESWLNNPSNPGMTAIYVERFLNYGLTCGELQSGRPVIGIAQSANDLAPCNRAHFQTVTRLCDGVRDSG